MTEASGRGATSSGWGTDGRGKVGTAVCGRYSCGAGYVLELSSAAGRPRSSGSSFPKVFPVGLGATRNRHGIVDKMLPRR